MFRSGGREVTDADEEGLARLVVVVLIVLKLTGFVGDATTSADVTATFSTIFVADSGIFDGEELDDMGCVQTLLVEVDLIVNCPGIFWIQTLSIGGGVKFDLSMLLDLSKFGRGTTPESL